MEKLKSSIPNSIRQTIDNDLFLSSSSVLNFLLHFPPFQQMIENLAASSERGLCGKNKDEALQFKASANKFFASGHYSDALSHYSQALRVAPIDADDSGKNLVSTLYLNRAFVFHKLGLLTECVRDCNRVIQISPNYPKAWYRRGMANASLGSYKEAIGDLNMAMSMEFSSGGKSQIENELKAVLNRESRAITSPIQQSVQKSDVLDETPQIKLQCVYTPDKARGMASSIEIPSATLVHIEEPFSAIISKSFRETHCHYCFNELPIDKVPCMSCAIHLYCSVKCQLRAIGKSFDYPKNHAIQEKLPENIEHAETILGAVSETVPEHKHECHGGSWPLVLPSEIVLAGRVLVKSMMQRKCSPEIANRFEILELAHHYSQMSPENKLELHIYSTVLLCCLERSSGLEIQINGLSVAQVITLVSQIRVNSMSIVRLKTGDDGVVHEFDKPSSGPLTSCVKQVKVGQAIYKKGSLFNHSCLPNVHAYFVSRTLFIRTTESVPIGHPLELSYGPQVGQWDCKDRIKVLEDSYSFQCRCRGCSIPNFPDLVLNAFRCVGPNCSGVVLDSGVLDCEKSKVKNFTNKACSSALNSYFEIGNYNGDDISEVAQNAFSHANWSSNINPGYCLSCGSYRDLESSLASVNKAQKSIRRLEDAIVSEDITSSKLSDASRSLLSLKSTLHAYNRSIAEMEDILAQAFCLVGNLQIAVDHCKSSIKILEKLYTSNHIVIGHELVKLASIQLAMSDSSSVDNINWLDKIFSCYYGSHADSVFPLLKILRKEAENVSC